MDVAVPQATGFPANGIEVCQCKPGYEGNSCQECSVGHYRDPSDKSEDPLGKCVPCRCSGNERGCSLDDVTGRVRCECKDGYTGERCEAIDNAFGKCHLLFGSLFTVACAFFRTIF